MRMTRKMRRAKERREMLNPIRVAVARSVAVAIVSTALFFDGSVGKAMPTAGQVTAGQATVTQSGNQMTVTQSTAQAALNWQSFSIGAQEKVRFIQPSAAAVALNRVTGTDASAIYGQLSANGRVFLVNPSGILFAPGSRVDVGGLVASTLSITNDDFMNGRYTFKGTSAAGVLNQGTITAADQGFVALLGAQAQNEGLIVAHMGTVALGAGQQVSLDFVGDGVVSLNVDKGTLHTIAANSGLVEADGGRVIMTARASDDLASAVVNQSGIIHARSLGNQTGVVTLASSGDINLTGKIDVSGQKAGQSGGAVSVVAGGNLEFPLAASIDASGTIKGGSVETSGKTVQITGAVKAADWLIDPIDITIVDTSTNTGTISPATSTISADVIVAALGTGNVTIDTATANVPLNNGDITVSADILATNSADRTLKLTAANNINIINGKEIGTNGAGRLNVTLESSNDGANGGYVLVGSGSSIVTNGGTVTIAGKEGQGANRSVSVAAGLPGVDLTGAIINTTTRTGVTGGDVIVRGQVNANAGSARGIDISGSSIITTGGGGVTLDGVVNTGSSDVNAAGVYLGDTTTINTVGTSLRGTVNIIGQNSIGNGIHLGGAAVTGGDLMLTADRISFGSGSLTGTTANSATITTTTSARPVSVGDDGGTSTLNVSNGAFTQLTGYGKHVIQSSGGAVTIANAILSQDTSIETSGSGVITVSDALQGSGKNVRLAAGASSGGVGAIKGVNGLRLETTGATADWNLTNVTNDVNTLSAQAQSVTFTDVNNLNLGQVSISGTAYNGITVTGSTSTITAAGGNVTLSQNLAKINGSVTTVAIKAMGDIIFTNDADATAIGQALNLNLYADTDVTNGGRVVGQGNLTSITTNSGALIIAGGDGTGYAKGTAAGAGVDLTGVTIAVGNGALTIRGEAFDNTTTGVNLTNANITRGSGAVIIEGKQPTVGSGPAVDLTGVIIGSGSGALTLTGDTMTFSGGAIAGSGSLRIQPLTASGNINLGTATGVGDLNIGTAVFNTTDATSIVKNGFTAITIGHDSGSGTITESGTFTFRDNLTIKAPTGRIDVNGAVTDSIAASEQSTLTLIAPSVNLNDSAQVTTHKTGVGVVGVTVNSTTTQLANNVIVNANGGDVSITADTLNGQDKTFSLTSNGSGILSILQKTSGRGLQLGGIDGGTKLFIDSASSNNITGFSHVKLGDRTAGGAVTIGDYTTPGIKTTVLSATANGAGTMTGNVLAPGGLVLATGGMNQTSGTITTTELGLIGSGNYSFGQANNQIDKVATDSGAGAIGTLTVINKTALTVGTVAVPSGVSVSSPLTGITATGAVNLTVTNPGAQLTITNVINSGSGAVTLQADEMTVTGNVRTTGVLTLMPNDATRVINVGNGSLLGLDFAASSFTPGETLGGSYSKIVIGSSSQQGVISVKDTTFSTPVELITNKSSGANVNLSGTIKVGATTAPYQDLTIRADQLITTGIVNVKNLLLDLNDFSQVAGTVSGSGNLSITGPSGEDIVLVGAEGPTASTTDYEIPYATVNAVFQNFSNFAITATGSGYSADGNAADVILQTGTLNRSLSLTSLDKVIVDGTVTIGAGASLVTVNAPTFLLNGGGSGATTKGTIVAGMASFTIVTDKIDDQQTNLANITGAGTLTVKPKTKKLVILGVGATGNENTELLLTDAQVNGTLFAQGAFPNLILGDRSGTTDTEIRGDGIHAVTLDNNLSISAGVSNKVEITNAAGLDIGTSSSPRSITLQAGTVSNSSGYALNAYNGTLTIAANTLSLLGSNKVVGAGTLGITTFDGSRAIYVGTDGTGTVLNLNQTLFNTGGPIDWTNFTHVKIGSTSQSEAIIVNGLTNPASLTGITFQTASAGTNSKVVFAGNLNATGDKVTVDTALSSQTGGVITASAVNLQTGDHTLNQDNVVDTIAADAKSVSFTSVNPLTVGSVNRSDSGSATSGITASGTGAGTVSLTGKNSTEETGGIQITQPVKATSSGEIVLTGDELKFSGSGYVQSSGGPLTLQPLTASRTITLGGMDTTGLDLPVSYFTGSVVKDGFSSVTIGGTGSSGTVNVIGVTPLVFVDDTIIQSPVSGGVINLGAGSVIQHGSNSVEFRAPILNANAGGTEAAITGTTGSQTFTVDRLNVSNGNFSSAGSLTIQPLTADRNITIGATASDPGVGQLFLDQEWFKSTVAATRTFNDGYSQITIGDPPAGLTAGAGTGKITVKDDVQFTDNTLLTALGIGGSIDIGTAGSPNIPANLTMANGDSLTLEARTITTYGTSVVESKTGTTTLTADTMSYDPVSRVNGTGSLIVQPYTTTRSISLGNDPSPGNTLNLTANTISTVFHPGHSLITIGRTNTNADITLNGVTFNDDLTLRNPGGGGVNITGSVDMTDHLLTLNVPGGVAGTGVLANVSQLSGTANSVSLTNQSNTIKKIKNLTTVQNMTVINTGTLSLDGTVSSTSGDVTIRTLGDLTLEATGTISALAGGGQVFLAADNTTGSYDNNFTNLSGSDGISAGQQFLVLSGKRQDTVRDSLTEDIIRFGAVDFSGPGLGTGSSIPTTQSGFLYSYQPIVRLTATKQYGDSASGFTYTESGTALADNGLTLAGTQLNQLTSYSFGNVNVNGVSVAGSPGQNNADVNAGYLGTFTGTGATNPFGILVQGPTNGSLVPFAVTQRPLTIQMANGTKDYGDLNSTVIFDGVTSNRNGGSPISTVASYSGLVNDDKVNSVTQTFGTFINQATNAGSGGSYNGTVLGANSVFATASDFNNYNITILPGNTVIKPRNVTIQSPNVSRVYGDANPTMGTGFTVVAGSFYNTEAIALTNTLVSPVGQFDSVNSNASAITPSNLQYINGANASNYNFTLQNGVFSITARPITIQMADINYIYGNTPTEANLTGGVWTGNGSTPNGRVKAITGGLVNGDRIATVDLQLVGISSTTAAGGSSGSPYAGAVQANATDNTANVAFSTGLRSNYTVTVVPGNATVTKAPLVVTAGDVSRTYGDANPLLTHTITGFKNGEGESVISGSVGISTAASLASNVGNYAIAANVIGLSAANYMFVPVDGILTVVARPLTITMNDVSYVYGNNPAQSDLVGSTGIWAGNNGLLPNAKVKSVSGLVNNDKITDTTLVFGVSSTSNVGNYVGSVGSDGNTVNFATASDRLNYTVTVIPGNATITKAPLTVTADNISRTYGDANPLLTHTIRGFKNGEGESVISGNVGISTAANLASNVGNYAIAADVIGLSATNYTFAAADGTLSVLARPLTITMNDASYVYGNNPALSSLVATTGIWTGNDGLLPNTKVKAVSGLVNGDKVTDIALAFVGVSGTSNAGSYAGSVGSDGVGNAATVNFETVSDRSNYTVTVINGNTLVTPRPITLTAGSATRVYGDANPIITDFTLSAGTLMNGNVISSVINTIAPTATVTANAGTSHIVSASLPVFTDTNDSNNYTISYAPGILTITQRPLIIQAPSGIRRKGEDNTSVQFAPSTFDQAVQVLADGQVRTLNGGLVTSRGLVNGDSVTFVNAPIVDTALTRNSDSGTYTDGVSVNGAILNSNNYQISYAPNTLKIDPVAVASRDVEAARTYSQQRVTEPQNTQPPSSGLSGPLSINSGSGSVVATVQLSGGGLEFNVGARSGARPEPGDGGRRDNPGIPVLYTTSISDNVRFDGVYKVNYTETKLSILPATLDVPIPDRQEITRGSFVEFTVVQRAGQAGSFEVNVGNGIITIKPMDEAARKTLSRQDDKNVTKIVMGAGILSAVQDLGVMPDQIRAIYIFTD